MKDMEHEAPTREIPMQPEDAEYVANVREGQVPTTHRRVWPAAQNLLDWLVRNADRVGLSEQVRGPRVPRRVPTRIPRTALVLLRQLESLCDLLLRPLQWVALRLIIARDERHARRLLGILTAFPLPFHCAGLPSARARGRLGLDGNAARQALSCRAFHADGPTYCTAPCHASILRLLRSEALVRTRSGSRLPPKT